MRRLRFESTQNVWSAQGAAFALRHEPTLPQPGEDCPWDDARFVIASKLRLCLSTPYGVRKAQPSLCGTNRRHRSWAKTVLGMTLELVIASKLRLCLSTPYGVRKAQPSLCGTNRRYRSLAKTVLGMDARIGYYWTFLQIRLPQYLDNDFRRFFCFRVSLRAQIRVARRASRSIAGAGFADCLQSM